MHRISQRSKRCCRARRLSADAGEVWVRCQSTALQKAQEILGRECSPIGLMASPEGYPHVWARDSVITALGALLAPGHEECLKTSLLTLSGQQSELGAIPNNVSVATGRLDHTNAGSVDSNLWFIIGREYYRNNNLNIPEQYHNGGIWPFVGGFYVAALVKAGRMEEARRQLEKLAKVNRLGLEEEWEFNEWCHGRTGRPMGYPHQAWSAGMYLYAYHCVQLARVPLLQAEQTMAKGDLTLRPN